MTKVDDFLAVSKMRDGPSVSVTRDRDQTTLWGKQRGQVFILDNRIGNNGLSEPQNAQDAKLLAPVIFMLSLSKK
jgi:hypothetical protein